LRSVINAAGGKSTIATLQRAGRGMRVDRDIAGNVKDGGDEFEVWDIYDRGNAWLEKHAKARVKSYQIEGHEVLIQQPSAIGK
jgi:superfamily II DNA or RNA helicase